MCPASVEIRTKWTQAYFKARNVANARFDKETCTSGLFNYIEAAAFLRKFLKFMARGAENTDAMKNDDGTFSFVISWVFQHVRMEMTVLRPFQEKKIVI